MIDLMVQDDKREQQMRDRFNLQVAQDRKRDGIDAFLKIDDIFVNFELKSTTSGSVSTVRDFGVAHMNKWKELHWIFAVYNKRGDDIIKCHYASPDDMAPWIDARRKYMLPDTMLGEMISGNVDKNMVREILREKEPPYSKEDAEWIMKKQWTSEEYRSQMDEFDGYSLERMTHILRLRCRYLMARGSTLNNPHIEKSFIAKLPTLDRDEPANSLREYVRSYFESASATEEATA